MIIRFERNDITTMSVDCIVNAANNTLLGGGGVDGQIHKAAGSELLKECMGLGGCETGSAKITKGYNLKAKYIIHTVGPIYQDGKHGEPELLKNCYYNSLKLAKENKIKTIAFPLISAGIFRYPKKDAMNIALKGIKKFGNENKDYNIEAILVFFGRSTIDLASELFGEIKTYIDDNYVEKINTNYGRRGRDLFSHIAVAGRSYLDEENFDDVSFTKQKRKDESVHIDNVKRDLLLDESEFNYHKIKKVAKTKKTCTVKLEKSVKLNDIGELNINGTSKREKNLSELINNLDVSFAEALVKLIDERKLKDVDVYNNANMDRKLFSKIRKGSHPKKSTAIALCISLELSLDETNNLIKKAGYAFTDSEKFDVIIKYFINNKNYDINEINAALFSYDQQQLGIV